MKIAVIGSGAWGTTLAQVLVDNHHDVRLFGRSIEEINEINTKHELSKYLPTIKLHPLLKGTTHLEVALNEVEMIVLSVPVVAIEGICQQIIPLLKGRPIWVNTAKGFDPQTGARLSDLIRRVIPIEKRQEIVSLIGPSYAEEVVQRFYTAISAVSLDHEVATIVQTVFSNPYFRVYTLEDEVGAEYGAATKNIIAVAAGIIEGLGYHDNTRAALITRGLAEIMKLGTLKGGKVETFLGLAGVGDLILTCSSHTSRNYQAGLAIGKAGVAGPFLKENHKTVEGILATKKVYEESLKLGIELPITAAVYSILFEGRLAHDALVQLMNRKLKHEFK